MTVTMDKILCATDGSAQESAMALTFSGPAQAVIFGQPVDLSRQRNGDMVLAFSARLDAVPTGPVELGLNLDRSTSPDARSRTVGPAVKWTWYGRPDDPLPASATQVREFRA